MLLGKAHVAGPLHGGRVGVPGRRRGRTAATTTPPTGGPRCASSRRRRPSRSRSPDELVPFSRWITPERGQGPLRHALLPRAGPGALRSGARRRGDRRGALVRARRGARAPPRGRAAAGVPDDQEARDAGAIRVARGGAETVGAVAVEPILPRIDTSGPEPRVLLPGDPDYSTGSTGTRALDSGQAVQKKAIAQLGLAREAVRLGVARPRPRRPRGPRRIARPRRRAGSVRPRARPPRARSGPAGSPRTGTGPSSRSIRSRSRETGRRGRRRARGANTSAAASVSTTLTSLALVLHPYIFALMTTTLPPDVQQVFERFITTEYTTVDCTGPADHLAGDSVLPARATARSTSRPGSAIRRRPTTPSATRRSRCCSATPPGPASIDPVPCSSRERRRSTTPTSTQTASATGRRALEKLPATKEMHPPAFLRGCSAGTTRGSMCYVRPERVFVWSTATSPRSRPCTTRTWRRCGRITRRSPKAPPAPEGGAPEWDARMDELGGRHETAVLTSSVRTASPSRCGCRSGGPGAPSRAAGRAAGLAPGRAQQGLPDRARARPRFEWQTNFQVRGDLVEKARVVPRPPPAGWAGSSCPKSKLQAYRENFRKMLRYRKKAKSELARRRARGRAA